MTARASARRYARALFDVARAEHLDLDTIDRELSATAAFLASADALQRALTNPAIAAARKRAVVERLLEHNPLTPVVARTLLLLADRDRLALLPDLAEAYHARLLDHRQIVRAEVTTAVALPPDREAALKESLAHVTGRQVQLAVRVDPAIIGGAVARVGSTVYDGSLATQLEKLKKQLTEADHTH